MNRGLELSRKTWKEVEDFFHAHKPVALIPIGAQCKEHGLHLPLNNDWILAEYLKNRLLETLPVVTLPTVSYGYYPAFLEYPGSVSLRASVFKDTVIDICRSLHGQGLRKFYALNTGVSTCGPLREAQTELLKEGILFEFSDFSADLEELEKKIAQQKLGGHADEIETSMMLYIAPESVRLELAQKDEGHEISPEKPGPLTRNSKATSGVYSPTGAWGDPTLANVKKGRMLVESLVETLQKKIEAFSQRELE